MSDVFDEAQALLQCKSCPWYKNCVMPMRLTEEDLRRQMEGIANGNTIPGLPSQASEFLSTMAAAAQNSLLEGCPVFINRLRNSPKFAEQIKRMMQEWSKEDDQVRIAGKKIDDLQEIMRLLKEQDYNIPLQFANMKS